MGIRSDHALTLNQFITQLQAIIEEHPEYGHVPILMACEYPDHEYMGPYGVYCGTVRATFFNPARIGGRDCLKAFGNDKPTEPCVCLYPW